MRRIYTYIILINSLLIGAVNPLLAQTNKKFSKTEAKPMEVRWWNGYMLQLDMASVVTSAINYKETYSFEGSAQIDLKHKFFPVIELGYAGADKLSKDNLGFKTNGLFGRVGLDFSLSKAKKDSKPTSNLFLAGVRLGMTKSGYDLNNVTITDDYWGGTEAPSIATQNPTQLWYELVLGVRVEIAKNIFMGWNVRSKNLLGGDTTGQMTPWYIPGYGVNGSSAWGLNYVLGFKF